jgi:hypothetical protein
MYQRRVQTRHRKLVPLTEMQAVMIIHRHKAGGERLLTFILLSYTRKMRAVVSRVRAKITSKSQVKIR